MFLKNASILYGNNLTYIATTNLQISNQIFKKIKPNLRSNSKEEKLDCEGLLVMPGFVNAHTHIGDSIAKDINLDSNIDAKIHPVFGIKPKIMENTNPKHLGNFMRNSCFSMIRKGITTFVDFREGGTKGIFILKKALKNIPIRCIILGRVEYYQNPSKLKKNPSLPQKQREELKEILNHCDGIGISGPNENSNAVLSYYSNTNKIRAIHAAESIQSSKASIKYTKKTETQRALLLKPHFLVHMTHACKNDLYTAARKTRGIVVCPRANGSLAEGVPNIDSMLKVGCNIAIGTDNVMINSPDIFREMDYLWKITMAIHHKRISPKEILKMATVNAGKLLQKKIGAIQIGNFADCIFIEKHSIDLESMHNPYASIVHRASESSIKAVMIGGKIAYGKI